MGLRRHDCRHRADRRISTSAPTVLAALAAAAGTNYAQQILGRKILLIDVVGQSDERKPAFAIEKIDATAGNVAVVGTVAGV